MNETINNKLNYPEKYSARYSVFLIQLAWIVEIIAVIIGFTISIVVAISAYSTFEDTTTTGLLGGTSAVLVSALPFVLIAIVELCKIPLTFTVMAVKHLGWKLLFIFFVIFLCLITFETMLNGFERNFSNLNRAIDERKNKMEDSISQIALLEKRRSYIVKFTEDELANDLLNSRTDVQKGFEKSISNVNSYSRRALAKIDYSFKPEIEAEIQRLMDVRDVYYKEWSEEKETIEDRFSVLLLQNISGSSEEKDRLLDELKKLKSEKEAAIADANFLTISSEERKYLNLIARKEDQIGKITLGYLGGDAIQKQSSMQDQLKQQLDFVNDKYNRRLSELNDRIEGIKSDLEERIATNVKTENNINRNAGAQKARYSKTKKDNLTELKTYEDLKLQELEVIAERSFGIDEKIYEFQTLQGKYQNEINHLINQNQVYRLAMYGYGLESATEVSRRMVGVVALLWFGSLSLIASLTGVMLALAGFYLRKFVEPEKYGISLWPKWFSFSWLRNIQSGGKK